MKIRKIINILLIFILVLTGFSSSLDSTNAKATFSEDPDQIYTFSVLSYLEAETIGLTQIEGNLGIVAEGAEVLGDWQVGGEIHIGPDSLAGSALEAARSINAQLAERACDTTVVNDEKTLTTVVLAPGVTCFEGETVFLTELLLESNLEEDAEFIIRSAGNIIFSEDSRVILAEPESEVSIHWQIAGSMTTGERSQLQGTFLVASRIETGAQTDVIGQLISLEGSILVEESEIHSTMNQLIPVPMPEPTEEPTPEPTEEPTPEPTEEPTPEPTEEPTVEPTVEPTIAATEELAPEPTVEPTIAATEVPAPELTVESTVESIVEPTPVITEEPIEGPFEETIPNPERGFIWKIEIEKDVDSINELASYATEFTQNGSAEGLSFKVTDMKFELTGDTDIDQLNSFLFDAMPEVINFLGGPIRLTVHTTSEVQPMFFNLQARNTTGFTWVFTDDGKGQVVQEGETITEGRGSGVGVPAIQTIELSPLVTGELSYSLDYKRLFEPDLPVRTTLEVWVPDGVTSLEIIDPTPMSFEAISEDQNSTIDVYSELNSEINALPTAHDWRNYGIVPAIRDQGGCGSCFAFGTVGIMESAIMKSGGPNTDLSEQFIVSCNNDSWNCEYGGLTAHKYHYNVLGKSQNMVGAVLEVDKPYTATNGTCSVAYNHPHKLTGWQFITGSEYTLPTVDQIKQAIYTYGPITAGVCVGNGWYSYSGGVYINNDYCGGQTNHQIILVGWNDSTQSWILRNSWGSNWGEGGYMRIAYNTSRVGEGTSWVTYTPVNSTIPTPISPNGYIYQKYPTFTWTKVANATSYNVQIWTASGRVTNKIVYPSSCGTTQCSAVIGPLPYVSQYYWRVNAYIGGWQPWSMNKYFTRLDPIPTLVWPSGTITISNPYFQWKPLAGATNYNIELYSGSSLIANQTVSNSSCNSTICSVRLSNNLPLGYYYWRVKSFTEGSWNTFSTFRYFTRATAAPTPILPSGTIYQKYPTFTWTKLPNATSYNVQVWTANGRVTNKIVYPSSCGATQCSAVIGPLPYVSQYYWRVSAYDGGWGNWSVDKYFTRLDPIPILVWPSGIITVNNPYFQWKPLAGATNYNVELYSGSVLVASQTVSNYACNSTTCSVRLLNNIPAGNYYWRVKSYTEGSWNAFSPFMYFTRPGSSPFQNPGFEAGSAYWTQSSFNGWDLIFYEPALAHGGSWFAWLGGDDNESAMLSQTITISPAAPYLHFWYYAESEDVCSYDYFYVGVNDVFFYWETLCYENNTGGWVQKVLDLSAFVGSNKTVQFLVNTDVSNYSNVLLDDISMSAFVTTSKLGPVVVRGSQDIALMNKSAFLSIREQLEK